jgi:hypothetical protein
MVGRHGGQNPLFDFAALVVNRGDGDVDGRRPGSGGDGPSLRRPAVFSMIGIADAHARLFK